MALYAVGDIQGCFDQLQHLLDKLSFDPQSDRLWFAGDLVNRGPRSLETLRFVRDLGDRAITVLGNHDLHLLAAWQYPERHLKPGDTLRDILRAPDRDELLEWLRRRPLMHHDPNLDISLVHAGLSPQWDLDTALRCAGEIESTLRGKQFPHFLRHMYGDEPRRWSDHLRGWDRLRFSVNCFTRLRYCTTDGTLEFRQKGKPGSQPGDFLPWFQVEGRRTAEEFIVFGHWSTLGLHLGDGVCALDTGCLWGGQLTAVRIDTPERPIFSVDCPASQTPGE